ncbi:serine carboxypeptidase-like 40 [Salvia hispanica]|uniref:serine carboxypeptidase-like 40 n=1 Tax=Salvia hispanica TaxID=49212 RepID=UPI002009AF50|nr:serine carboxypeptidase-like 40 [Salvia hispanica]
MYSLTTFLLLLGIALLQWPQIKATNQIDFLSRLYKEKFHTNSIDRSYFNASHHSHNVEILSQKGLKENDLIEKLPGQPHIPVKQYGGYVTVNQAAGRAFYYYFVEAQPRRDHHKEMPLLLWLNGGPGCSSLAYGAMQELGPFRVHSDGKTLYKNPWSWHHAANLLFLESPAGVGFSYSNTTSDFKRGGDAKTAIDNYAFLVNWLERFPEYKGREFFISGESYAGHYVPQLAHTILHHNKKAGKTIINLKGILIGNAVINDETDAIGMYEYYASHALVSDEITKQVLRYCDFSPKATEQSDKCNEAQQQVDKNTNNIDIYSIYSPLCHNSDLTPKPTKASVLHTDPCSDYYVYAYLNRKDVQKALHANVTKIPYDWEPCSNVLEKWTDSAPSSLPLLQEFMANGLRVWVFSGDTDGRVPVTSTKISLNKLKLPMKTLWHPWFLEGEVGGYTQVYKGDITFATVRGAGHQVPSYQPARALSLVLHFVDGTELPNSSRL